MSMYDTVIKGIDGFHARVDQTSRGLHVKQVGGVNLGQTLAIIGVSATMLAAGNSSRTFLSLNNRGTVAIYLGIDVTTTAGATGNNFAVLGNSSANALPFRDLAGYAGAVWAILATGTSVMPVSVLEVY